MNCTTKNFIGKYYAFLMLLFFGCTNAFSQFTTPRITWDGPYDIKMIGSAQHIPVYFKASNATSDEIYIDSIVRQETITRSGGRININNDISSSLSTIVLPKTAFMCNQDPNVGICTAGLPVTTNNTACPAPATNFKTSPLTQNMPVTLTYADFDNDNSTFSSSMAQLTIPGCSQIVGAYLYWTGGFKQSSNTLKLVDSPFNSFTTGVPNASVFNIVNGDGQCVNLKMKVPGSASYTSITADQIIQQGDARYICYKDVSTLVKSGAGSGQYWVADLKSWPGDNHASAGWGLIVVYGSPLSAPRIINIFDGYATVPANTTGYTVTVSGLQVPATSNFSSYIGMGALDCENLPSEYPTPGSTPPYLEFTSGSITTLINQFETRKYVYYDQNGFPTDCAGTELKDACNAPVLTGACMVYDGVNSSRISTYDEVTGQNGAEVVRLPTQTNTYGVDFHHIKLPAGSIQAGSTSASLKLTALFGDYNLFMTYFAFERLQPKLVMTKTPSVNTTTPSSTYNYTLRVTNIGNTASLGARIFDTLDVANNYVTLASSTRYSSTGTNLGAAGVVLESSASDKLRFSMPAGNPIGINEYVDIVFTVNVEPGANTTLWNTQCKRTIENTAWVRYKTSSAAGNTDSLTAKSNSNDCGIGTETKVLVTGLGLTPTNVSSNTCPSTSTVIDAVKAVLLTQPGITAAMLSDFDIRDASNVRVPATDMMSAVVAADMPFKAYRDVAVSPCQEEYAITFTGCGLPVKLISFEGWRNSDVNSFRWITASEKENDYFVVETSVNGKDFVSLGTVQGNGNSSTAHTYAFSAEHPSNGINYYRLKQVDFNGSIAYSKTIAIDNKEVDMDIYPNPNHGAFTIRFIAPGESYKLEVTDVLGKTVYSISGHNVPESIEVNDLAKGVYLVRFYLENKAVIKKMMVY